MLPPRYMVTYARPKRDEEGNLLCHICGHRVPKGRRTLCGSKCAEERAIRGGRGVREAVFKRDKGICARCGLDCEVLRDELDSLEREQAKNKAERRWPPRWRGSAFQQFLADNKLGMWNGEVKRNLWETHHKVAVKEGGGQCGLENYATLCCRCHARETGRLRKRLNAMRNKGER